MEINKDYINEYKEIIQTTELQKGYQELMKFFRLLRIYLEKELEQYKFTGNIVENNMDYSYFQFTDEDLKVKGLKIVLAFVHRDFNYEVWLSGLNRDIQKEYHGKLSRKPQKYWLTHDPNRTDYILKVKIPTTFDYDELYKMLGEIKNNVVDFVNNIKPILQSL